MSERDHTDTLIATLLRDEAERASDGIRPPKLVELQIRAGGRRRRRTLLGLGALAAAAAVAAVVWVNLPSAGDPFVAPADGPIADTFEVPTYAWDEGGGDDALVAGSLAFTDAGCPLLVFGESATALFLPNATGVTYDNGVRGVVDARGRVYATEGQTMEYAGGWQEPMTGEFAASWEALCGATPARDAAYVNDVAAHEPLTEAPPLPAADQPTAPTTREEAGWFDVPTFAFGGEAWPTSEEALFEGTVEFTEEGCPVADGPSGRTGLVFPNAEGFDNPDAEEPRMVYAYFEGGTSGVIAIEGEPGSWGGGYREPDHEFWTGVCQGEPVDRVFIVQDSPFE
ncbi:hypothetical protein [Ornithinimicrobium cavernae]|uniref:hypothetical protein n=1 Tax=Ornithinimicrobium cavernae TaxID=2666047 RepID=UPI000D6957E3|nr:hypothetical protein [Ornithinimicrobium cavernae]